MVRISLGAAIIAAGLAMTTAPAMADDTPGQIALSLGRFDSSWIGETRNDKSSAEFRLDYRFGTSLIPAADSMFKLRPWVGVEVNADRGLWAGGGLLLDVVFAQSFYLSPSIGVGGYSQGASKDLGSAIELRSTLEGGYRFSNDFRIGGYISHISNAGLSHTNPGANELGVTLSVPVTTLF